jgi:hypothetical protein
MDQEQETKAGDGLPGLWQRWVREMAAKVRHINGNLLIRLGDKAGGTRLGLRNTNDAEVFGVDSMGRVSGVFANRVTALEREIGYTVPNGYTLSEDFTATTAPAGLTFASTPFNTPAGNRLTWGADGTYYLNSDYTLKSFLYSTSNIVQNKIYFVRCAPAGNGGAGIRLDDGSNNNYAMTWLKDMGNGTCQVMREIRTGGGSATTSSGIALPIVFQYRIGIYYAYNAGTWIPYTYIYGNSLSLTFSTPAAQSWTPTRWGAVHNPGGEVGYSYTDWLAFS